MFLKILVVCVFICVSEAVYRRHGRHSWHGRGHYYLERKTVIIRPAPKRHIFDLEQMDAFLETQRNKLFDLGKKIDAKTADICRWNFATLTDDQKRSCSCLAAFGFLNESEGTGGDPFSMAFSIFTSVMGEFNLKGGPLDACSTRDANSPRQMHDICICFTGQSLV